jgi:hypothetical protein
MITKEEEKKFIDWVMSASSPIDERSEDYYHRGFLECGIVEREPTAKEKWENVKNSWGPWMGIDTPEERPVSRYFITEVFNAADSAIKEAEEKSK